jgi:hypothetical protein
MGAELAAMAKSLFLKIEGKKNPAIAGRATLRRRITFDEIDIQHVW